MEKIIKQKIIVAMSGGVDSSVAAALLKKQGHSVIGIFMKFWKEGRTVENSCCSVESEKRARQVAKILDIPFYVLNAEKEFKKKVVDYFLKEYKEGNTPNPCVICNKEIKFGFLIKKALKMGADHIATGHYANTTLSMRSSLQGHRMPIKLLKGRDREKDQSYFLWRLNQKQLSRVLFPVGGYTKPQVRALAKKFKLPVAETSESQEICFIDKSINEFLRKYIKNNSGKIINKQGKVLGGHNGLWFYTIGQRRGLGISQGPHYVVRKDFKNNDLIVSKNQKDLFSKELILKNVNWIFGEYAEFCDRRIRSIGVSGKKRKLPLSLNIEVKIRYKSNFAKAKIYKAGTQKIKVVFQKPQKAITPGQSAVFYNKEKEYVLGGGTIYKSF